MVFYLIATIVMVIMSVVLVVAVVLQESQSSGLSGSISGGSSNYWSGSRSKEGRLAKITTIAGIIFIVAAILLNVGLFTKM
ncbi:MAG: preprotein translocase subunit SecG [Lachnospiraceae bacterium]